MSRAREIIERGKALGVFTDETLAAMVEEEMGTPPPSELHTHPEVGHIAGVGMKHPEKLTLPEIQTLCGEVDRHIRRMKGKG